MSTVQDRGAAIYAYMKQRQDQRFTLGQLCRDLAIQPGDKTTRAIRHARDLATADGLHLPPAVPHNQFTYCVTSQGIDAVGPAIHMARIARGVQRRADVGYDFAEAQPASLPEALRVAVLARQRGARETARYLAAMDQLVEDVAEQLRALG